MVTLSAVTVSLAWRSLTSGVRRRIAHPSPRPIRYVPEGRLVVVAGCPECSMVMLKLITKAHYRGSWDTFTQQLFLTESVEIAYLLLYAIEINSGELTFIRDIRGVTE